MVKSREVKLVMSPGELTIRIEKRWIARHGLVQQFDCLTETRHPVAKGCPRKHMTGARIEIESDEIAGGPALNRQSLSSRDFGAKPLSNFLRNLALDRKQIVQIAIVLLGPDVSVGAGVDQLHVHMKLGADSPDAALQHMRYSQLIPNLTHIPLAAIAHYAGPADDFQIGDPRQLGQNVVLHAISKDCAIFLLAQIFKRQNGDSSCYGLPGKFAFPNHDSQRHCQGEQHCCQDGDTWISPHPFFPSRENSGAT